MACPKIDPKETAEEALTMSIDLPLSRIGPFRYQRFAAPALPALQDGIEHLPQDRVLIAGAGPVGLAVALGLARYGVRSLLIEADDSVCEGSRAACISRRSLEILQRLGVADAVLAKGLPWTDGHSFYRDHEVLHFSMPHDAQQRFAPMVNLQQYYIEQVLQDRVREVNAGQVGCIEVRWASSVTGLELAPDGTPTLTVQTAQGSYRTQADWLVACDGGQSFVRRALGLELVGTAYEGRYVIIDIELPSTSPTERRAWFDPPWCRGSTVLMHRQPDDIWRIDYQLRAGESTEAALTPARVQEFVQRHLAAIGEGHLPWKPVWTSVYRAGAMTLDAYRHGRVLFAGNAAHALPIFGVRGLNSGFDDADNLAWKLALVINGHARDALLDSYSSERIEAFEINAENAMRSTEFMSPPSRGFDLLREAALSLARAHSPIAKLINPRQTHAIHYADSPLSSADDAFASGPPAGSVLIDLPAGAGGRMHLTDALQAPGFTLLVFGDDGAFAAVLQQALDAQDNVDDGLKQPPFRLVRIGNVGTQADLEDPNGRIAARYGATAGSVYLVRPDGHVAARWHRPEAAVVQRALQKACGLKALTTTEQHA